MKDPNPKLISCWIVEGYGNEDTLQTAIEERIWEHTVQFVVCDTEISHFSYYSDTKQLDLKRESKMNLSYTAETG